MEEVFTPNISTSMNRWLNRSLFLNPAWLCQPSFCPHPKTQTSVALKSSMAAILEACVGKATCVCASAD